MNHAQNIANRLNPPLRWVGSKRRQLKNIIRLMPKQYGTYYEPFFGGGALFFALQPKHAVLCDNNAALINFFNTLKNDYLKLTMAVVKKIDSYIHEAEGNNILKKEIFKMERKKLNDLIKNNDVGFDMAVQFAFCIKTCFGGAIQINKSGEYTFCAGVHERVNDINASCWLSCGLALKKATIRKQDYSAINPAAGDFVYIDPPYYSAKTRYGGFEWDKEQHKKLADWITALHRKGVYFVASNYAGKYIERLYKDFYMEEVAVRKGVTPQGNTGNGEAHILIANIGYERKKELILERRERKQPLLFEG